jgi:hypothetical protein
MLAGQIGRRFCPKNEQYAVLASARRLSLGRAVAASKSGASQTRPAAPLDAPSSSTPRLGTPTAKPDEVLGLAAMLASDAPMISPRRRRWGRSPAGQLCADVLWHRVRCAGGRYPATEGGRGSERGLPGGSPGPSIRRRRECARLPPEPPACRSCEQPQADNRRAYTPEHPGGSRPARRRAGSRLDGRTAGSTRPCTPGSAADSRLAHNTLAGRTELGGSSL